jgi:uncharacterized protein YciI
MADVDAIIEVRTYRAKPGMRTPLLELLRSRAFPIQRALGMKILGPFPSLEDDIGFVWLRAFPDEASREWLKAAFYEGTDWLNGLEADVMPMLDDYSATIVKDTADLWSRWPNEVRTKMTSDIPLANFALTLVRGPNWDEHLEIRQQQSWNEHADFMDGLVREGFILLGGPVGDNRQTLHVVEAVDEDEVRRRMSDDPWSHIQLLEVGEIRPWSLWLDMRGEGSAS